MIASLSTAGGQKVDTLMHKLLKEDEKRKERELLVMRVEKGVCNILVKPSPADVGATTSDGGDRHGGPADRGG
eukprot:2087542-Amphidinium_carterae.2